jgi:hypothetical protein
VDLSLGAVLVLDPCSSWALSLLQPTCASAAAVGSGPSGQALSMATTRSCTLCWPLPLADALPAAAAGPLLGLEELLAGSPDPPRLLLLACAAAATGAGAPLLLGTPDKPGGGPVVTVLLLLPATGRGRGISTTLATPLGSAGRVAPWLLLEAVLVARAAVGLLGDGLLVVPLLAGLLLATAVAGDLFAASWSAALPVATSGDAMRFAAGCGSQGQPTKDH